MPIARIVPGFQQNAQVEPVAHVVVFQLQFPSGKAVQDVVDGRLLGQLSVDDGKSGPHR